MADWKDTAGQARRAAILIEWLVANRDAAFRFMVSNRFKDLWLAGVTKAIGEKATASELLAVANGTERPGDAVYQVARWDNPGAINGLANLMPSVNIDAAGPTAGAIGNLLAGINLDRAMDFAMGQATDQVRSFAVSGVMDGLSSLPNGEAEIRSWYASLPSSLQTANPVLAAYGIAIGGSDPTTALQDLEAITSPQSRMVALLVLVKNTASSSPETAIAAIYTSGLSPQGIYNHVNQVLQDWSAVDPQAASNFLTTTQVIPSGDITKYAPIVVQPGGGKP